MIYAFHLTWTTYGHWFPNDPRGSWSQEIWQPALRQVRELDEDRFVLQPRAVPKAVLQRFMNRARSSLRHRTVVLGREEIVLVGTAFEEVLIGKGVCTLGCAIMRDHVHVLVRRPDCSHERLVSALKGRSAQRVRAHRGIPIAARRSERVPIWTVGYWVRYVPKVDVAEGVARYIEENPPRHGLPVQRWGFVGEW